MLEDRKLIFRVITFELTQHIRPRYINVTDGRTEERTTYCSNTMHIADRAVKTYQCYNKLRRDFSEFQ